MASESLILPTRFRTYEGALMSVDFNGLGELGSTIAGTKDFYVCAAKRYYKFFTGIDVPIYDFNDPTAPDASDAEKAHRDSIINMGLSLKNHQDLSKLIRDIISLPVYRERGFGG